MFIADAQNSLLLSSFCCAGWTVRGRWKLVYKRAIKGYYAQGRVGRNSKLFQAEGFIYVFFHLQFFRSIVAFDGLGLDDDGRVAFLEILTLVRYDARHVATAQRQSADTD